MTEGGFYGSAFAAEIDRSSNGMFFKPSSSGYELTGDFGRMFKFKDWSTGFIGGRCVLVAQTMRPAVILYRRFALARRPVCVPRALGSEPWPVRLACKSWRSCVPAMYIP